LAKFFRTCKGIRHPQCNPCQTAATKIYKMARLKKPKPVDKHIVFVVSAWYNKQMKDLEELDAQLAALQARRDKLHRQMILTDATACDLAKRFYFSA